MTMLTRDQYAHIAKYRMSLPPKKGEIFAQADAANAVDVCLSAGETVFRAKSSVPEWCNACGNHVRNHHGGLAYRCQRRERCPECNSMQHFDRECVLAKPLPQVAATADCSAAESKPSAAPPTAPVMSPMAAAPPPWHSTSRTFAAASEDLDLVYESVKRFNDLRARLANVWQHAQFLDAELSYLCQRRERCPECNSMQHFDRECVQRDEEIHKLKADLAQRDEERQKITEALTDAGHSPASRGIVPALRALIAERDSLRTFTVTADACDAAHKLLTEAGILDADAPLPNRIRALIDAHKRDSAQLREVTQRIAAIIGAKLPGPV